MARERGKRGEQPSREAARPSRDPGEPRGPEASERSQGPQEREGAAGSARGAIPDLMRKALSAGFSGLFLTEETLRRALGDTLPKEWSDFAVEQSRRAQSEFMDRLSVEFGRALDKVDPAAVLSRLLEGRTVEVKAEIRLRPDPRVEPKAPDGEPGEGEGEA